MLTWAKLACPGPGTGWGGMGWTGGPLRLGWVGQYGLLGWRVPYLPASPRPAHTSPRPAPTRQASAIPTTPRRPIEPMPGRPITAHPLACSARPGPARRHTLDQSARAGPPPAPHTPANWNVGLIKKSLTHIHDLNSKFDCSVTGHFKGVLTFYINFGKF